jgi:iron complex transport system ATP-binding protein
MRILEAKNIGYSYEDGDFSLKDVSFFLNEGESAALIGPNGAGKTTLVKILAGLTRGYTGNVFLAGKPVNGYTNTQRASLVSYIPQIDNLTFDFSVEDIVGMGRRPYINETGALKKSDRDKVAEAILYFGLDSKKTHSYNSLSGGEKRMALIARAFAQEAKLLIMDEPLTYLDVKNQSELMEHISRLNNTGHTILMISHGINLAAEYVKRVILMKDGRVEADGSPHEVIEESVIRRVYGLENFYIENNKMTGKPNLFMVPGSQGQNIQKVESR